MNRRKTPSPSRNFIIILVYWNQPDVMSIVWGMDRIAHYPKVTDPPAGAAFDESAAEGSSEPPHVGEPATQRV